MNRGVVLLVFVAGCKAQVNGASNDAAIDLSTDDLPAIMSMDDGAVDLATDLACSGPKTAEICGNGCDDDHNGYFDDDDPACTPQVIATAKNGSTSLNRLFLASPHSAVLNPNAVGMGAHATYETAFSSSAFYVLDAASKQLFTLPLPSGMPMPYSKGYATWDACIFNGELIVVDPAQKLHRLQSDGVTETVKTVVTTLILNACASDGNYLYLSGHPPTGGASQFLVLDKTLSQVATPPMPALPGGLDRVIDFAWSNKQGQANLFYGLFANSDGGTDPTFESGQVIPFTFDGGSGPPIDAGVLHGLGEFLP